MILPGRATSHFSVMARALLPAFSLLIVLGGIAWLNPRAISYFGFNLMLSLAIPMVLATLAQMFVIAGNDLDLSIGPFIGFAACVSATWLHDAPLLGVAILVCAIGAYAAIGALIYLRDLPSVVVTLGMGFVWQGLAILVLPQPGGLAPTGWFPSWVFARLLFRFRFWRRSCLRWWSGSYWSVHPTASSCADQGE